MLRVGVLVLAPVEENAIGSGSNLCSRVPLNFQVVEIATFHEFGKYCWAYEATSGGLVKTAA